ncbi:hypothetical protein [Nocardia wallacei]|uniref:hypothetical protein n=1 Tax=Nocardia wallacei TaxID=480035 RepID=UPI00245433BF|nr:hypothetical protein [Nocardia wallacei]
MTTGCHHIAGPSTDWVEYGRLSEQVHDDVWHGDDLDATGFPAAIAATTELQVDFVTDGDTSDSIHRSIRALRDDAVAWAVQHLAPIPAHSLQVTVRCDEIERPLLTIDGPKSHAIDELTEWLDTERGRTP